MPRNNSDISRFPAIFRRKGDIAAIITANNNPVFAKREVFEYCIGCFALTTHNTYKYNIN